MTKLTSLLLGAAAIVGIGIPLGTANSRSPEAKPTVLLVHGAFADSSSWNQVVPRLHAEGYPVFAAAIPLRSLREDSDYLATIFRTIPGRIVAVGHSYAGAVITNAAAGNSNVQALVYVDGLAPEPGESVAGLSERFPGGTLGPTLAPPIALPDGGKDLYIQQPLFWAQFAADLPQQTAEVMAVTQRPITEAALHEPALAAAWKEIPSFFIFGALDKNVPKAAHLFMARRAGALMTIEVPGASHVVMLSSPMRSSP